MEHVMHELNFILFPKINPFKCGLFWRPRNQPTRNETTLCAYIIIVIILVQPEYFSAKTDKDTRFYEINLAGLIVTFKVIVGQSHDAY